MKKILVVVFSLFLSLSASAHVCQNLRDIKGFNYSILFNNTIMNGKPLNYYNFDSECQIDCLYKNFKNKKIRYSTNGNSISIFDATSVATITVDSTDKYGIYGYLTCSSSSIRHYISMPINVERRNITLDLQTEDNKSISRLLNIQKYNRSGYVSLVRSLDRIASTKEKNMGLTLYKDIARNKKSIIKISDLSPSGDFILIVEKLK